MAGTIYAFAERSFATEVSLRHIRRLALDEVLSSTGYSRATALCGAEVQRDISEVSDSTVKWSHRMRQEGRAVPGRICLECSHLYDEREV